MAKGSCLSMVLLAATALSAAAASPLHGVDVEHDPLLSRNLRERRHRLFRERKYQSRYEAAEAESGSSSSSSSSSGDGGSDTLADKFSSTPPGAVLDKRGNNGNGKGNGKGKPWSNDSLPQFGSNYDIMGKNEDSSKSNDGMDVEKVQPVSRFGNMKESNRQWSSESSSSSSSSSSSEDEKTAVNVNVNIEMNVSGNDEESESNGKDDGKDARDWFDYQRQDTSSSSSSDDVRAGHYADEGWYDADYDPDYDPYWCLEDEEYMEVYGGWSRRHLRNGPRGDSGRERELKPKTSKTPKSAKGGWYHPAHTHPKMNHPHPNHDAKSGKQSKTKSGKGTKMGKSAVCPPKPPPSEPTTASPTRTPTPKPTPRPTEEGETKAPTPQPTPKPTEAIVTDAPTKQPIPPPTPPPTPLPTPAPQPGVTDQPTKQPTPEPTPSPVPGMTSSPTAAPIEGGTVSPAPTNSPTASPVEGATASPTKSPNDLEEPTYLPSYLPTKAPSADATDAPTREPTNEPTRQPIVGTLAPTAPLDTNAPSAAPTGSPSATPSESPSAAPTISSSPTSAVFPSAAPTSSSIPTAMPSADPSSMPSMLPSSSPSTMPSVGPTTGAAASPSTPPSETPSSAPVAAVSGPTTIAPTAVPPGAEYFTSFEKGALADYPEWASTGTEADGTAWIISNERAESGVFSAQAPDLDNDARAQGESTLTLNTNPAWGAGTLHFSVLGGAQMPIDIVEFYVDGNPRGGGVEWGGKTEFEPQEVTLAPGPHVITWVYKYNPIPLPPANFPPDGAIQRAGVFLDDVYFVPLGASIPTPPPAPTTIAPTSVPAGASYYNGFEKGDYPEFQLDQTDDGGWFLTTEEANDGVFSLRSPDLADDGLASGSANFTFQTNPDWPAGTFHFSAIAGTRIPLDQVTYYVDGEVRGGGPADEGSTEFVDKSLVLSPGAHDITWEYKFNPLGLPQANLPPTDAFPDRIGYFIDDVYFVPAPNSAAIGTAGDCVALDPNPDDFEDGTFPLPPWSTGGDGEWAIATDTVFSGANSLRSPDFDGVTGSATSNATLQVCDDFAGGTLTFQALASVLPPSDIFVVYVDGESAAQLVGVYEWTEVVLTLSPGPHRVDFSYQYNIFGVDPLPPSPPDRQGAVWIDAVELLGVPASSSSKRRNNRNNGKGKG